MIPQSVANAEHLEFVAHLIDPTNHLRTQSIITFPQLETCSVVRFREVAVNSRYVQFVRDDAKKQKQMLIWQGFHCY